MAIALSGELARDRCKLKRDGDQHKAVPDRLVKREPLAQEKADARRIHEPARHQQPKIDGGKGSRERFDYRDDHPAHSEIESDAQPVEATEKRQFQDRAHGGAPAADLSSGIAPDHLVSVAHHDIKISDAGVYVRQSFVSVYESGLRAILSLPIALRYLLSMFDPLARVTYSQILSAHQEEAEQEKALIGRDILQDFLARFGIPIARGSTRACRAEPGVVTRFGACGR